jgi:hypothetical protein
MQRQGVQSSNIKEIGHDQATLTLEIEFLNGSIYQFFDVPRPVYEQFMQAPSHGQFFSQQIKGKFRHAKL